MPLTPKAKPDMVASSEMRSAGRVPDFKHGLLPGVKTGRFFNEKGELEVAGLHKGIVNGIGYPEKS